MDSDAEAPSRTARKKASEALQDIGQQLLDVRPDVLASLPLPETLQAAILEAKRLRNLEAKRRQAQFIGKLMRRLDAEAVEAVQSALRMEHGVSAKEAQLLHRAEQWRDALIADDERMTQWMKEFPETDREALRALVLEARNQAREGRPGEAPRKGSAYRRVFQIVRAQLGLSGGG